MSVPSRKLLTGFNPDEMAEKLHRDEVITKDDLQEIKSEELMFDKARTLLRILGAKPSSPKSLLLVGDYLRHASRDNADSMLAETKKALYNGYIHRKNDAGGAGRKCRLSSALLLGGLSGAVLMTAYFCATRNEFSIS